MIIRYNSGDTMEEAQDASMMGRLKVFWKECIRVLKITKKPTGKEFKTIVIVTGLGILLIGLIGFLITLIAQTIRG